MSISRKFILDKVEKQNRAVLEWAEGYIDKIIIAEHTGDIGFVVKVPIPNEKVMILIRQGCFDKLCSEKYPDWIVQWSKEEDCRNGDVNWNLSFKLK
jgi:hypothetical protein